MKNIFLIFFLWSIGLCISNNTICTATDTTDTIGLPTNSNLSTSSSTLISPYITEVIFDDTISVKAGETIQLKPLNIIWSDGINRDVSILWSGQYVNPEGYFSATQTGIYSVTINIAGIKKVLQIQVKPAEISQLQLFMQENPIYGRIYNKNKLFIYKGYDKYGNSISINPTDVKNIITFNGTGTIALWVGTTKNETIDKIIYAGNIQSKDDEILFFEKGTFTIKSQLGSLTSISKVFVNFDERYKNITPWQDYHLANIDFDKHLVEVEFEVDSIKIPYSFSLFSEWINRFNQPNFINKLQVICWIHYKILEIREQVIQKQISVMFNELILKPIFERLKK